MTAALYAFSASLTAALATRAWLQDRDHPARRAFMALGWTLALAWLAFALAMLPGLQDLHLLYIAAGPVAPALGHRVVDLMFRSDDATPRTLLPAAAAALGVSMALAHALLPPDHPLYGTPELVSGGVAWSLLAAALGRLWAARARAGLEAERRRLTWLAWAGTATLVFSIAETAVRTWMPADPGQQMAFFDRGVVLQGAVPPLSAMAGALTVYVMHHYLEARRLVALQEVLARLAATGLSALVLLVAHTLTLRFVELARFPLHSSYLLFLATGLFLSVWATAHRPLHRAMSRLFLGASQDLADAADVLRAELPRQTEARDVAAALAERLHAAGRFRAVGVYLFDPAMDAYRLEHARGPSDRRALEAVAADPIARALARLPEPLVSQDVEDTATREVLSAMAADFVWPLRAGDAVAGWITALDAEWSDGLTEGERVTVGAVAQAASTVLGNLARFRRMEEEHRLASIGTMSAGLAHEIRNPLAGLKGAAQVLQGEALPEDAQEMLGVIVEEVGRLDRVVTRFLDLARPIALQRRATPLSAVVRHALTVVRAAGLPDGVRLEEHLDEELPPVSVDPERMVQVLLNLLRNAIQAVAGAGTVIVRTRRRIDPAGRPEVEIAVLDDGPGLAPEAQRHLFTPFHTTRPDGTGLGLAISQRLVQAHGGTLDVQSQPNAGTTVAVRLPVPPAPVTG